MQILLDSSSWSRLGKASFHRHKDYSLVKFAKHARHTQPDGDK